MEQLQAATLAVFNDFQDPFSKVSSTHLRDGSVRQLFHPAEPEGVIISHNACRSKMGKTKTLAIKTKTFYYVL